MLQSSCQQQNTVAGDDRIAPRRCSSGFNKQILTQTIASESVTTPSLPRQFVHDSAMLLKRVNTLLITSMLLECNDKHVTMACRCIVAMASRTARSTKGSYMLPLFNSSHFLASSRCRAGSFKRTAYFPCWCLRAQTATDLLLRPHLRAYCGRTARSLPAQRNRLRWAR